MNLPGNYTGHGRAHRILNRLAGSTCLVGHLFKALGYDYPCLKSPRRKFWRLMDHLIEHGLISRPGGKDYALTPYGLEVLTYLNATYGEPGAPEITPADRPVTSVRIFVREVAA